MSDKIISTNKGKKKGSQSFNADKSKEHLLAETMEDSKESERPKEPDKGSDNTKKPSTRAGGGNYNNAFTTTVLYCCPSKAFKTHSREGKFVLKALCVRCSSDGNRIVVATRHTNSSSTPNLTNRRDKAVLSNRARLLKHYSNNWSE